MFGVDIISPWQSKNGFLILGECLTFDINGSFGV